MIGFLNNKVDFLNISFIIHYIIKVIECQISILRGIIMKTFLVKNL